MSNILNVILTFYDPFKINDHLPHNKRQTDQRYLRFESFADWHRPYNGDKFPKPYIRGRLIRSNMIKYIEDTLALFSDQAKKMGICPGTTLRNDNLLKIKKETKTSRIQQRDRYLFGKEVCQSKNEACPFCEILGVFNNTKQNKPERGVWIKNFIYGDFEQDGLADIDDVSQVRFKNRIDKYSRKASGYFQVREVDHTIYNNFIGEIELDPNLNNIETVKILIAVGLARIHNIAGAACRLDIVENINGKWDNSLHQELLDQFYNSFFDKENNNTQEKPIDNISDSKPLTNTQIKEIANKLSENIIEIINKNNSQEHMRKYADALNNLRSFSNKDLATLPEYKNSDDKFFWGFDNGKDTLNIKNLIIDTIKNKDLNKTYQRKLFFENIGDALYRYSKQIAVLEQISKPIYGDKEYYATIAQNANDSKRFKDIDNLHENIDEWIITGELKAKTPFLIGTGSSDNEQVDIKALIDSKGNIRVPYDTLLGRLRYDLSFIVSGCMLELGSQEVCECPVCDIVSRCNFQSAVIEPSDAEILMPDIRNRIQINPKTGTVEEGALMNMEVCPEGVTFPFILRFRSENKQIDAPLLKVLSLWTNGQCFLGGHIGIGKGRFELDDLKFYNFSLHEREDGECALDFISLMKNRNFIDNNKAEINNLLREKQVDINSLLPNECTLKSFYENELPYEKIKYKLIFHAPVLVNDPIAAMYEQGCPDALMFKKNKISKTGYKEPVYCLKGEGIRGAIRYLVGKTLDLHSYLHEEIDCVLCEIFGNEHVQGNIIFEDAELVIKEGFEDIKLIKCDHVAIDWNGGAKKHAKFNDYPLPGSPNSSLEFEGVVWVKKDLNSENQKIIRNAFIDLQDGMTTIGSNAAIGYGRVIEVQFENQSNTNLITENFPKSKIPYIIPNNNNTTEPEKTRLNPKQLSSDALYNPYYYIFPNKHVQRFSELITHDRYHEEKLSGKIICQLKTLTPLFIPDTTTDKAFDEYVKQKTTDDKIIAEHRSYKFFRINNEIMIPGSSLRGMIAYIYQILTNSCFRNLDESQFLTRRMDADEGGEISSGIVKVINGNYYIIKADRYRLPLYDDKQVSDNELYNDTPLFEEKIDSQSTKKLSEEKKKKYIKKIIENNKTIAKYSKKNREFLENIRKESKQTFDQIISGKKPVFFRKANGWPNKADVLVYLISEKQYNPKSDSIGYFKFTGLNNANKTKETKLTAGVDYKSDNDIKHPLEIKNLLSSTMPEYRPGEKFLYPRPVLYCLDEDMQYTISKRCERLFKHDSDIDINSLTEETIKIFLGKNIFMVSDEARKQYESVVQSYMDNTGKSEFEKKLQTVFFDETLCDDTLIYFKEWKNNAVNIVPVTISRKSDHLPMGKRFLPGYDTLRPCEHECIEECNNCNIDCLNNYLSDYFKGLCPTCSLFGTTSYQGRVRVGFGTLKNNNQKALWYNPAQSTEYTEHGNPLTLKLLEEPRATWPIPNQFSQIIGRKIYVNHPNNKTIDPSVDPSKNNTTVEPLGPGNIFNFQIDFENLNEWELGCLLYTLELEPQMAHRLGMSKSRGFGSVDINVDDIIIRQVSDTEKQDCHEWTSCLNKKNNYIYAGKKTLETWFKNEWENIKHITNLRYSLLIPHEQEIRLDYLDGIKGHKEFKSSLPWHERQAVLCTPWHNIAIKKNKENDDHGSLVLEDHAQKISTELQKTEFEGEVLEPEERNNGDYYFYTIATSGGGLYTINDTSNKYSDTLYQGDIVKFKIGPEISPPQYIDIIKIGEKNKAAQKALKRGKVKNFDDKKRYGFIKQDGGQDDEKDIFVHQSDIKTPGLKSLNKGDRVTFEIIPDKKRFKAINVKIVK